MKVRSVLFAAAAVVSVVAAAPASAIIGGTESPSAYPFSGGLVRPGDGPTPDSQVCGVTLIAPRWVVTASHCARTTTEQQVGYPHGWSVRLGSTSRSSGGEVIPVEKFVRRSSGPHLDRVFGKDIALLKLVHPAKAKPIGVAATAPAPGTPARIIGWGDTCGRSCYPDELHEADTQVQPSKSCPVSLTDLCIGALDGKVAPGNTDSGGPALIKTGAGWVIAGVVSGGNGGTPGIYTNLATFRGWILQTVDDHRTPTLDGAARLGSCSGAVVRKAGALTTDPALLLTNGHCITGDRPAAGSAVTNRPEARDVVLLGPDGSPKSTVYPQSTGHPESAVHTTKLLYATMTGTDVALYQLDKTYARLPGVTVFDLATTEATQAERIDVLAASSKKAGACAVANVLPRLREGGYTMNHAIQYTEDCSPGPGDSGSPIIDASSGRVVGVHNTSNGEGGLCTEGNPCEVDDQGRVTSHPGRTYGQQTAAVPACLGPGSTVDLSLPGCDLTKPKA